MPAAGAHGPSGNYVETGDIDAPFVYCAIVYSDFVGVPPPSVDLFWQEHKVDTIARFLAAHEQFQRIDGRKFAKGYFTTKEGTLLVWWFRK